jgi:glyoxylase-like metal-dependent hydrolase (beta-lactamase superfamily II)
MHSDDPPADFEANLDDSPLARIYAAARLGVATPATRTSVQQHLEIIQLTPTLRRIELRTPTLPPATHTGCYVIGPTDGPGELCLVDPGSPYPDQQTLLDAWLADERRAARNVRCVLLTHHHGDHMGGAAHLAAQGIPVWAHALTQQRVAARVDVARLLDDGAFIELGDATIKVIWTPGHAAGHLCFAVSTAVGLDIIAGDMVAGVGTILIDPDEGEMADYLASLRKLAAHGPCRLHPAHGPVIVDGVAKLQQYEAHRLRREQQVCDALAAATTSSLHELVQRAYADTPPALWPLAARSLLAHLLKLQRDQRAAEVRPGVWRAGT